MAEPNYDIDKDAIESEVNAERDAAIKESDAGYDSIIATNKATEQSLLDKIGVQDENGNWNKGSMAYIQTENANKQTEFAIEKIEQQKEQAKKDYTKEQSAAYKDYQKQIDPYGVNAEKIAAMGLSNTGYSESAKVSMYNQYQNRVAVARESYNQAVLNYNNGITEAKLQNSSVLAEIYSQALAKSLEVTLNFASQNNTLLVQKVQQRNTISEQYHKRYMDVLNQINQENAIAENVRQHNEQMAYNWAQFNYKKEQDAKAAAGGNRFYGGNTGDKKDKGGSGASNGAISGASIGSKKTTTSKEESSGELPKKTKDSLIKAGMAGRSAAAIDKEIRDGKLIETVDKNGNLVYNRKFNGSGLLTGRTKIGG